MLLSEDVEVFVVTSSQQADFHNEYVKVIKQPLNQSSILVKEGEDYSIAIVFGKDFDISTPDFNYKLDRKVSACRVRISIDEGIAVAERLYKMPDTAGGPRVHHVDTVFSRSVSPSGAVRQYRPYFTAIPKDLIHGSEMPPDLRAKLGHIDVEIDRGYLDYSAKAAAPSPDYVPDCFDSRWFVASRQLDCFRTRLNRHNGPQTEPPTGAFISLEAKQCLRILTISDAIVKKHQSKKLELRETSPSWESEIAALRHTLKPGATTSTKAQSKADKSSLLSNIPVTPTPTPGLPTTPQRTSQVQHSESARSMKNSMSKASTKTGTPLASQTSEPSSNTKKRKRIETEPHSQTAKLGNSQNNGQAKDKSIKKAKATAGEMPSPSIPKRQKATNAKTSSFVAIKKELMEPQTSSHTKTKRNLGFIDLTDETTDEEDSDMDQPEVPKAKKAKMVNKEQATAKEQPIIEATSSFDWRKAQAQLKALYNPDKPVRTPQHHQSRAGHGTDNTPGSAKPQNGAQVVKESSETSKTQPGGHSTASKINNNVSSPPKASASKLSIPVGLPSEAFAGGASQSSAVQKDVKKFPETRKNPPGSDLPASKTSNHVSKPSKASASKLSIPVSSPSKAFASSALQRPAVQKEPEQLEPQSSLSNDTLQLPADQTPLKHQEKAPDSSSPVAPKKARTRVPKALTARHPTPPSESENESEDESEDGSVAGRTQKSKRFNDLHDMRYTIEKKRLHDAGELKLNMALYKFQVLEAENAGVGNAKDIIWKRILVQRCKMQLAQIEVDRLSDMVKDREAPSRG